MLLGPWGLGLVRDAALLEQAAHIGIIIALAAVGSGFATTEGAYLVKIVTVLTFIVSSYWVVLCYPTPIAVSERLRRD